MTLWAPGLGSTATHRTRSAEKRSLGTCSIKHWTRCAPGASLSFARHEARHGVPKGWAQMTMDWSAALLWRPRLRTRRYQRRTRDPISVEAKATPAIATPYQVTKNSGLSSVQCMA